MCIRDRPHGDRTALRPRPYGKGRLLRAVAPSVTGGRGLRRGARGASRRVRPVRTARVRTGRPSAPRGSVRAAPEPVHGVARGTPEPAGRITMTDFGHEEPVSYRHLRA